MTCNKKCFLPDADFLPLCFVITDQLPFKPKIQPVHRKCFDGQQQSSNCLFSGENKKTISKCHLLKFLPTSVLSTNIYITFCIWNIYICIVTFCHQAFQYFHRKLFSISDSKVQRRKSSKVSMVDVGTM